MSEADEIDRQREQDRLARNFEQQAETARQRRRMAWLRLHEDHGYKYADLARLTGYGTTTIHTELRRARDER